MRYPNLEILNTFDESSLPDLDVAVLGALELFSKSPLPSFPTISYTRPLVVGSGGAAVTGKILFEDADAAFADESTYEKALHVVSAIDGAVLVSASGGKHAIRVARFLQERGVPITLITNNSDAPAKKFVNEGDVIVFPKNREPYTYNTSTYLGMILASTREDPSSILSFITEYVVPAIPDSLSHYDAFFIMIPSQYDALGEMFSIKFDELFGPKVNGRVFTLEQAKHAKTVISSEKECFIHFGGKQDIFGDPDRRVEIPLPAVADFGAMMAIGYCVIGHIQKQHRPYFKENIAEYVKKASKMFSKEISTITE